MKKVIFISGLLITILIVFSSCYHVNNTIRGNGSSILTESYISGQNVTSIEVNNNIDVEIIPSDENKIVVTAQPNIMDLIYINIIGDIAKIELRPNINIVPTDMTKVSFYIPNIKSIKTNGSGDVFCFRGFPTQDRINLQTNGSGDITISGINCLDLILTTNGSGDIKSEYIECEEITTNVRGSGNITVLDISCLKSSCRVNGSGNIKYKGVSGSNVIRIEGSGKVDAYDFQTNNTQVDIMGSGNSYVWAIETLDVYIKGSGNVYYKGSPDVSIYSQGSGRVIPRPINLK